MKKEGTAKQQVIYCPRIPTLHLMASNQHSLPQFNTHLHLLHNIPVEKSPAEPMMPSPSRHRKPDIPSPEDLRIGDLHLFPIGFTLHELAMNPVIERAITQIAVERNAAFRKPRVERVMPIPIDTKLRGIRPLHHKL